MCKDLMYKKVDGEEKLCTVTCDNIKGKDKPFSDCKKTMTILALHLK